MPERDCNFYLGVDGVQDANEGCRNLVVCPEIPPIPSIQMPEQEDKPDLATGETRIILRYAKIKHCNHVERMAFTTPP